MKAFILFIIQYFTSLEAFKGNQTFRSTYTIIEEKTYIFRYISQLAIFTSLSVDFFFVLFTI